MPRRPSSRAAALRLPRAALSALLRRAPLLLGALLASGCLRADVFVEVHDDGSGVLHLLYAFDREIVQELLGETDADRLTAMSGIDPAALPEDATYEPIETDDELGADLTLPVEAAGEVAPAIDAAYASLGEETGALVGAGGPFESFNIDRDEDRWHFEARMVPGEAPDELTAVLLGQASFTFRLRLPGELGVHNAERIEDGVLAWDLPLTGEGGRSLHASSVVDHDEGVPVAAGAGAVAALVAAAGAAVYLLRRRARRVDATPR